MTFNTPFKPMSMHLKEHDLVAIKDLQAGSIIECEQGALWITVPGDPQDYMLTPGERFVNEMKNSKVLIEALHEARMALQKASN